MSAENTTHNLCVVFSAARVGGELLGDDNYFVLQCQHVDQ